VAALTTNVVPLTGLRIDSLFAAAAGGGDDCETGPGIDLIVKTAGTITTVTLATPETFDGDLAMADRAVTTVATGEYKIPITSRYRNPSTGRCAITYSTVTGVTVCVTRTVTT
jgi:hypothetical protein